MSRYLLSVAELARIIHKSHQTIYRMVESGELPFGLVPGLPTKHFRRVDVEAWLGRPVDDADLEVAS